MSQFVITLHTQWGWRKGADTPELMTAWDDVSVDENLNGWNEACEQDRKSWGDDLSSYRFAKVNVDYDAIVNLWAEPEVEGNVA